MARCVYINLEKAAARRAAVEASFARVPHNGWTLERYSAVKPGERTTGAMPPTAQACFLSHLDVLTSSLGDEDPIFICEDDVEFSTETFRLLSEVARSEDAPDVLFTDTMPLDLAFVLRLARSRRDRERDGRRALLDLTAEQWAGSTAYLVKGSAKAQLHARLADAGLDRPYDLRLHDLCRERALTGRVVFPFITTVQTNGSASQIDVADDRDHWRATLNVFRRLMFIERGLNDVRAEASALLADDDEAIALGAVLASMTRPTFPVAR